MRHEIVLSVFRPQAPNGVCGESAEATEEKRHAKGTPPGAQGKLDFQLNQTVGDGSRRKCKVKGVLCVCACDDDAEGKLRRILENL